MGDLSHNAAIQRTQSARDALSTDQCKFATIADQQQAGWLRTAATNLMTNWLTAGEPFYAVSAIDLGIGPPVRCHVPAAGPAGACAGRYATLDELAAGRPTMPEGRGKAGLEDVARLAAVGVATVDRVLNERGNVAPATARRVIEAARQLDLKRILPHPYVRRVRIEVLLARADPRFLARLIQGFDAVAATLDRAVILLRTTLPEAAPTAVAARLRGSGADGFILYGEDHPDIAAAVDALAAAGRPVVSIVTDVSLATRRLAYVGIDNLKAGRTAGFLAARLARRPGACPDSYQQRRLSRPPRPDRGIPRRPDPRGARDAHRGRARGPRRG